jgi:microcystin-dependent protein
MAVACLLFVLAVLTPAAQAEDQPFVGEMIWVPYNFAPKGWAFCNGQILPISQNTALFSLLGTTYGGDGRTNFALPDMRGRLMVNSGQFTYVQGESGGETSHTLSLSEMPAHNHQFQASSAVGTSTSPANNFYAQSASGNQYGPNSGASLSPSAMLSAGGGQPHNNMMPYGTLNCIIALQGIFPPRP